MFLPTFFIRTSEVYAVVFMDAIHYHVRSEGRIVKRAVYIALGIDMDGRKDILGMYPEFPDYCGASEPPNPVQGASLYDC